MVTEKNYISTVNSDTVEGSLKIVAALNGADSLSEIGTKPLNLVDIIKTPGVRSRTGEVCTNAYLIDDKGNAYFTQSDGICKSLDFILMAFNGIIPDGGIKVQVKERKISSGNTLKTLVPVTK